LIGWKGIRMFKSVVRETSLTEKAQRQVEALIVDGTLKAGDRLPSERELTEQLKVSKTVIREAIRSLVAKGLIDVRVGSGMYVRGVGSDMMKEPMSLLLRSNVLKPDDVFEVREALEVTIAGLAAERASEVDLKAMEENIKALKSSHLSAADYAELDVGFHRLVVKAAGNPLFAFLLNSLNDVMIEVRLRAFSIGEGKTVANALQEHLHIFDRIKAHDAAGARVAMQKHLTQGMKILRKGVVK
jgi:GntR family transcriptional regulator, transcriptional repressor for pyruvate dehydrogenase complex